MTTSLLTWIGLAVLLFWAVGAYNRLVRLRAEVNASFAQVDGQLQQQLRLVDELLPTDSSQPASLFLEDDGPSFWSGLQGASAQLAACLAAARVRPLNPNGIAALAAASDVLAMAWNRAEREDAHDLAGPRLPEDLLASRAQLVSQTQGAVDRFNDTIVLYNAAIAQFPAVLLAWVFGFKRGRTL
jgi:LemA protein